MTDDERNLFVDGEFTAHSGGTLPYKIECDVLTDGDLATLGTDVARRFPRFSSVYGVPRGGVRFADALIKYATDSPLDPVLIVDDVLTTGVSMEEARERLGTNTFGIVIFAHAPCPEWVTPLFTRTTHTHTATIYYPARFGDYNVTLSPGDATWCIAASNTEDPVLVNIPTYELANGIAQLLNRISTCSE